MSRTLAEYEEGPGVTSSKLSPFSGNAASGDQVEGTKTSHAEVEDELLVDICDITPAGDNKNLFSIDEDSHEGSPSKLADFHEIELRDESQTGLGQNESIPEGLLSPDTGESNPGNSVSNPYRRRRSSDSSSISNTGGGLFPIFEVPGVAFHVPQQSDLESCSEWDEGSGILDSLSKADVFQAYVRMRQRYHKYKGRYSDLVKAYDEKEKETEKLRDYITKAQDKAMRRLNELKEQCALEQQAKAHLEGELRSDLEERDHKIAALQMKVRLMQEGFLEIPSSESVEQGEVSSGGGGALISQLSHLSPQDDVALVTHRSISEDGDADNMSVKSFGSTSTAPPSIEAEQLIEKLKGDVARHKNLLSRCRENIHANKERITCLLQERDAVTALLQEKTRAMEVMEEELKMELQTLRESTESSAFSMAETKKQLFEELQHKETESEHFKESAKEAQKIIEALQREVEDRKVELSTLREELKKKDRILEEHRTCNGPQELLPAELTSENVVPDLALQICNQEKYLSQLEVKRSLVEKEIEEKMRACEALDSISRMSLSASGTVDSVSQTSLGEETESEDTVVINREEYYRNVDNLEKLKEELAKQMHVSEQLNKKLNEMLEANEFITNGNKRLVEEVRRLKGELEGLHKEVAVRANESQAIRMINEDLKKEKEELNVLIAQQTKESKTEKDELNKNLYSVTLERDSLMQHCEELRVSHDAVTAAHQMQLKDLGRSNKDLENIILKLREENTGHNSLIEDLRTALKAADVRCRELTGDSVRVKGQVEGLRLQLTDHIHTIHILNSEVQQLQISVSDLQERNRALTEKAQFFELNNQVLSTENDELLCKSEHLCKENSELCIENKTLRMSLATVKSGAEASEEEASSLRTRVLGLEEAERLVQEYTFRLEEKERATEDIEADIQRTRHKIEWLEAEHSDLESTIEKLKGDVQIQMKLKIAEETKAKSFEAANRELVAEVEYLEKSVAAKEQEIECKSEAVHCLESTCQCLQAEGDQMLNSIESVIALCIEHVRVGSDCDESDVSGSSGTVLDRRRDRMNVLTDAVKELLKSCSLSTHMSSDFENKLQGCEAKIMELQVQLQNALNEKDKLFQEKASLEGQCSLMNESLRSTQCELQYKSRNMEEQVQRCSALSAQYETCFNDLQVRTAENGALSCELQHIKETLASREEELRDVCALNERIILENSELKSRLDAEVQVIRSTLLSTEEGLMSKITDLEAAKASLEVKIEHLLSEKRAYLEDANRHIECMEQELANTKQQLSVSRAAFEERMQSLEEENVTVTKEKREELIKINDEKERLADQLKKLQNADKENEQLRLKVQCLEKAVLLHKESLRTGCRSDAEEGEFTLRPQFQCDSLTRFLALSNMVRVSCELEKIQQKHDAELAKGHRAAEEEKSHLTQERVSYQRTLAERDASIVELKDMCDELRAKMDEKEEESQRIIEGLQEDLKKTTEELQTQGEETRQHVAKLLAAVTSAGSSEPPKLELASVNEQFQGRIDLLEKQAATSAKLIAMLEFNNTHFKAKVCNMELSNNDLKEKVKSQQLELEALEEKLKEGSQELMEKLMQERAEAEKELLMEKETVQQQSSEDIQHLKEQIAGMAESLKSYEKQVLQLEDSNSILQLKMASIQDERDATRQKLEALKEEKAKVCLELEQTKAVRDILQDRLTSEKDSHQELELTLEKERNDALLLTERLDTLTKNVTNLQKQLECALNSSSSLQMQLDSAKSLQKLLESENIALKSAKVSLESKVQDLENECGVLNVDKCDLCAKLDRTCNDYEMKCSEFKNRIKELESEKSRADLESGGARVVKFELEKRIAGLEWELSTIRTSLEETLKDRKENLGTVTVHQMLEELLESRAQLECRVLDQDAHVNSLQKDMEGVQHERSRVSQMVEDMKNQLMKFPVSMFLETCVTSGDANVTGKEEVSGLVGEMKGLHNFLMQKIHHLVRERETQLQKKLDTLTEDWNRERKEVERLTQVATEAFRSGTDSVELLKKQVSAQRQEIDDIRTSHKREVSELQKLLELKRRKGKSGNMTGVHMGVSLEDAAEFEYLRNVLYQYMIGKETQTLSRVLCAVVKFSQEQQREISEQEERRQSLLKHMQRGAETD